MVDESGSGSVEKFKRAPLREKSRCQKIKKWLDPQNSNIEKVDHLWKVNGVVIENVRPRSWSLKILPGSIKGLMWSIKGLMWSIKSTPTKKKSFGLDWKIDPYL